MTDSFADCIPMEDVPCEECGADRTVENLGLCPLCMVGKLFEPERDLDEEN
jgi:hypothetical protein